MATPGKGVWDYRARFFFYMSSLDRFLLVKDMYWTQLPPLDLHLPLQIRANLGRLCSQVLTPRGSVTPVEAKGDHKLHTLG